MDYDPWTTLHSIPRLTLLRQSLPGRLHGVTDGRRIILDDRLTEREARCALTHELVHFCWRQTTCQPAPVEREVRAVVAHLLVPEQRLHDVACWTDCWVEAAEELYVTGSVLRDRVELDDYTI